MKKEEIEKLAEVILKTELQKENFDRVYVEETSQARPTRFIDGTYVVIKAMKEIHSQALQSNEKKFSEEDMINAYDKGDNSRYSKIGEAVLRDRFIHSLTDREEGEFNCPSCERKWDSSKHNACECGAEHSMETIRDNSCNYCLKPIK